MKEYKNDFSESYVRSLNRTSPLITNKKNMTFHQVIVCLVLSRFEYSWSPNFKNYSSE